MKILISAAIALGIAAPVWADGFGFRTPSGNIYCNGGLDGAHVGCTIVNRESGSAPAGVGACPAGRVFSAEVEERGPATASCGGPAGRLSSYSDVADYGVTGTFGAITCTSQQSGFSCVNADGHGFFLSRREQRVF